MYIYISSGNTSRDRARSVTTDKDNRYTMRVS